MADAEKILIIDDDNAVRATMRIILERAGYRVIEASDGVRGVELYRENTPTLVITDLFMPRQDGIETIQQLRGEFPGACILAVSGGTSTTAAGPLSDARLLGADQTLAKPFSKDELLLCVQALIAGA
jgi:DNA-binding response OmpR family regulator